MFFQFVESDEKADRVMSFCAVEAQDEGNIGFRLLIIVVELEEGIVEVIFFGRCSSPRKRPGQGNGAWHTLLVMVARTGVCGRWCCR